MTTASKKHRHRIHSTEHLSIGIRIDTCRCGAMRLSTLTVEGTHFSAWKPPTAVPLPDAMVP